MKVSNKFWVSAGVGYGAFCLVNYLVAKATAGTVRTGAMQTVLGFNDTLLNFNLLNYVLGAPTSALPPSVTPVTLPGDTVTAPALAGYSKVVPFRIPG